MKYIASLLFILLSFNFYSQNIPERPNPPKLVNDFADILTSSEEQQLENKLVKFNNETSTQIVVISVKSLDGYDKFTYAYKIGEKWAVGQEKFNNGIVVLIKDKTANSKGEIFIATGYGIEALVPDATTKKIIEIEMIPQFKNGNIYLGIDKAVNTLISLTKGEFTADKYNSKKKKKPTSRNTIIIVILIIIVLARMIFKNRGHSGRSGGIGTGGAIFMGSTGGSWNSFSSGSGGFGGFGGGSFGGGGAGGSW